MPDTEPPQFPEFEKFPLKHSVYFIAGILGTDKGGQQIFDSLKKTFGEGNVNFLHSIVSTDRTDSERHTSLANQIHAKLSDNQSVVVATHSLGAIELLKIIEQLEVKPEIDNKYENLSIVLISPYGLVEGARNSAKLLRFLKLVGDQLPIESLRSRKGIDSFAFLPPKGFSEDELTSLLFNAFPELSMFDEEESTENSQSVFSEDGYFSTLTEDRKDEIRIKVADIDSKLKSTLNQNEVRKLIRERGKILSEEMARAYRGSEQDIVPEQSVLNMYKTLAQAHLGLLDLLKIFAKGKALKALKRIREKGASVMAVFPEYDVIYTTQEYLEHFGDPNTVPLRGSTHMGFAQNAAGIAEAICNLVDSSRNNHIEMDIAS